MAHPTNAQNLVQALYCVLYFFLYILFRRYAAVIISAIFVYYLNGLNAQV